MTETKKNHKENHNFYSKYINEKKEDENKNMKINEEIDDLDLTQHIEFDVIVPKIKNAKHSYAWWLCHYQITSSLNDVKRLDENNSTWGRYCKFLSSEQQFHAVFCHKSQVNLCNSSQEEFFILPVSWWRQWWDYINVEFDTLINLQQKYTVFIKDNDESKHNHHAQIRQAKLRESYGDSLFVQNFLDQTFEENSMEDITSKISLFISKFKFD